jgi:Tetracyclin repressor-like, C-terminal domain
MLVEFLIRDGRLRAWSQRSCGLPSVTNALAATPAAWHDFTQQNAELAASLAHQRPLTAADAARSPSAGPVSPTVKIVGLAAQYGAPVPSLSLMSSQMVGLAMIRYVWKVGAIAQMSSEDVVCYIAPTIQRYLSGRLGS